MSKIDFQAIFLIYFYIFKICYKSHCVNSSNLTFPKLPVTPCIPNPCLNGGSCIYVNQFYFCKCVIGFKLQYIIKYLLKKTQFHLHCFELKSNDETN